MVAGELAAEGTPSELKAGQKGRVLEIVAEHPQRASRALRSDMERWRVSLFGDRLHVIVDTDPETAILDVTRRLAMGGLRVLDAYEEPRSLEDVFIAVVRQMQSEGKTAEE